MDYLTELKPVFMDIMELDDIILTPELNAADVEEWDSLNHIRFLVAIETKFNVKFSVAEMAGMKNLGDLIAILTDKKPPA